MIVIFGATGLLGTALKAVFNQKELHFLAPAHAECDVTNRRVVARYVRSHDLDFIINCVGYTRVDDAEVNPEAANLLNAEVPAILAEASGDIPLLHFSTDYIFDGKKKSGYSENESGRPLSVYGKSKWQGERNVRNHKNHYIIRTAWLFGEGKTNFVDRIIESSRGKREIRVVYDQIGCPTYTLDLAQAVADFIEKKYPYGTYHLVNSEHASRVDVAREIFPLLGIPVQVIPCASSYFPQAAQRPHYSVLRNTKLPMLRSWSAALADYLKQKVITYEAL